MYQEAADIGLFHEGKQPRSQGDSASKSVMTWGVVQSHSISRMSGSELVKAKGTINSPETISLGKVRSLVQVIQTISVWVSNRDEHRCNYRTAQTRTRGIELTWSRAPGPRGERGSGCQGKVVRTLEPVGVAGPWHHLCECCLSSKEWYNEWTVLFSNVSWCLFI